MQSIMYQVNVKIVKRSDHAKGFVVLPKRWVVESKRVVRPASRMDLTAVGS